MLDGPDASTARLVPGLVPGLLPGLVPCDVTFVSAEGTRVCAGAELRGWAEEAATLFRAELAGRRVGLVFRSEPALLVAWLGLVSAGFEPLILQYPTQKQNREVWRASVTNSAAIAALDHILCAHEVADLLPGQAVPFGLDRLTGMAQTGTDRPDEPLAFRAGAILQLSSGTTGHRKALHFTHGQIARHVADYNHVMRLGPDDVCVSWLPLYHDMGFVACWLMPLFLGVPVVMIDPIDWVRQPGLLFDAIAAHRGTYCYMPNFGFEIMARQPSRDLASMRRWVSCSEPVYAETAERFLAAHRLEARTFAACYAMAENVFAVTQSDGLAIVEHEGQRLVSCGAPIPGVRLEIREGQVFVASPTAMQAYLGGDAIADENGFYPTGDLGHLEKGGPQEGGPQEGGPQEGGLVVTGRTGDLLNIAGRKYMLNDLDFEVNRILPDVRGRAAALAAHSDALGTDQLLVLAESEDFYKRQDQGAVAARISDQTGIEALDFHFVPPGFITKTSSGKINRTKTADDWRAAKAVKSASKQGFTRPAHDVITELFPNAPFDLPIREAFDSLGLVVVRMLLEERSLPFSDRLTLRDLKEVEKQGRSAAANEERQIRVFNLGDYAAFKSLDPAFFDELSTELGVRVTYEQFCAPPASILLNDLVFHDYFMTRDQRGLSAYQTFSTVVKDLKAASVIIVDDFAEYYRAQRQPAPALNHAMIDDPDAARLAWRFQRYTWDHHTHALKVVEGDQVVADVEQSLADLSTYLQVPLFRVAFQETQGRKTRDWDYVYGKYGASVDYDHEEVDDDALKNALKTHIARNLNLLIKTGEHDRPTYTSEFFHFCSALIDKEKIQAMIDRHDRFLIFGPNSSLTFLREEIGRKGKHYKQVMDWAREGEPFLDDFDCIVLTGSWVPQGLGRQLPTYQVFWAGFCAAMNDLQLSELWFYEKPVP